MGSVNLNARAEANQALTGRTGDHNQPAKPFVERNDLSSSLAERRPAACPMDRNEVVEFVNILDIWANSNDRNKHGGPTDYPDAEDPDRVDRQWRRKTARGCTVDVAARRIARSSRAGRHQKGLRPRSVRRLHCFDGWTGDPFLSDWPSARPNHVGVLIARHKRAGRIEERDGKLYATHSTATEQGDAS
jgi:hypothetical protein